jgi:hypothetical protein
MTQYPLAGNPMPVSIVGGGSSSSEVIEGLDGNAIGTVRQMSPVNSMTVNGTSVSGAIDKRGYASVGIIINSNFTGTKIRYQVSLDNNVDWAYFIDPSTGTPFEATLLAASKNAFLVHADVFPFPFVRIVFLNASSVLQNQTNLNIRYCLIS